MRALRWRRGRLSVVLLFVVGFLGAFGGSSARADKSGVRPNVIDVPKGPGSISGLGEQFEPNLNTGSSSYSVKIALPPGTSGFTPSLALSYDSGQGNGPVGIGWTLDAGGIQRQTDKGLPRYGASDRFLYNGRELVPVAEGVYRLKQEGEFTRFRYAGGQWEADLRDGGVLRFGLTPETRVEGPEGTFRWALEQASDVWGNRAAYTYQKDRGQLYLTRVSYNLRAGSAVNRAELEYEDRPDAATDCRGGFPLTTAKRLGRIRVFLGEQQLRRYELTYDALSTLSRLATVTLFGADDTTSLPPLTLGYTGFEPGKQSVKAMSGAPSFSLTDPDVELIDFDGDSLPDLFSAKTGRHTVAYNSGDHWAAAADLASSPSVALSSSGVQFADLNGDGIADLVAKLSSSGSDFKYFPNRGAGRWESSVLFTNNPSFSFEDLNVRLLDFDGDGLVDVMQTTSAEYYYWRNRGDGSWERAVVGPTIAGTSIRFEDPQVKLADMNGDRLVDVVFVRAGAVSYWPNLGYGRWGERVALPGAPDLGADQERLQVADLNGDGLADLLVARGTTVSLWLQKGDGTFASEFRLEGLPEANPSTSIVRAADMNGSGTTDIVWNRPYEADKWQYLDLSGGIRPNLLTTIDNGLGRNIELRYTSTGALFQDAKKNGSPWSTRLPFPVQVVERVTVSDGRGWQSVAGFEYRDGYYDGATRQFRGFGKTIRTDSGTPEDPTAYAIHEFDVGFANEALKGALRSLEVRSWDDKVLRRDTYGYDAHVYLTGLDGRLVAGPVRRSHDVSYVEGTSSPVTTREEFSYDEYGDLLVHSEWGIVAGTDKLAGNDERVTTTEYAHNHERWILGRPTHVLVTDGALKRVKESRTYYDGEPYVGLPFGELGRQGAATRTEEWVEEDRWISTSRAKRDEYGNVVSTLTPRGATREVIFDEATHVFPVAERIQVAEGKSLAYGATYFRGMIESFTDPNGATTRFAYDPLGRLMAIARPGDDLNRPTLGYRYNLGNPLSNVTIESRSRSGEDAVYRTLSYRDSLGRTIAELTQAENNRWVLSGWKSFSRRGSVIKEWDPLFVDAPLPPTGDPSSPATAYFYDSLERRIGTDFPDGTREERRYGPLSVELWDAEDLNPASKHRDTPLRHESDGLGRTIATIENLEGRLLRNSFGFDPVGHETSVTNALGAVTSWSYDGLGRTTSVVHPDAGTRAFKYDDDGNETRRTDALGQRVERIFDHAGRVTTETYFDANGATTGQVGLHYDDASPRIGGGHNTAGKLSWVSDLAGEEHFLYDERGRTKVKLRVVEGKEYRLEEDYDNLDHVSAMRFPDGQQIDYTYNERGLLQSVPRVVKQLEYDASGLPTRREFSNGVVSSVSYDLLKRVSTLAAVGPKGKKLQDLGYGYDLIGSLQSIEDKYRTSGKLSGTRTFVYDDLYRMTSATSPLGTSGFDFDVVGNLRTKSDVGAYVYGGAQPNAVQTIDGQSIRHDANGAVTASFGRVMDYDALGQLRRVTTSDATTEYTYDYSGRRISKTETTGGSTKKVVYLDRFAEVRDGELVKYVFAGEVRLARIGGGTPKQLVAAALFRRLGDALEVLSILPLALGAALIASRRSARQRLGHRAIALALALLVGSCQCGPSKDDSPLDGAIFYTTDHLGSTALLTDTKGTVVGESSYDAWGQQIASSDEPHSFNGKEWDAKAGLLYFGARYYDPRLGRFLSVDPVALAPSVQAVHDPQTLNPYAYARNSPARYVDHNGLAPSDWADAGDRWLLSTREKLFNGAVQTGTAGKIVGAVGLTALDLARVFTDALRFGEGIGEAAESIEQGEYWMAAAHVAQDVTRGATIFNTLAGGAESTGVPAASRPKSTAPTWNDGPCFAAGTLVAAERGLVPIEEIAAGERVWSRDEATGEVALRAVTRTYVTPEQPLLAIAIRTEDKDVEHLLATEAHPFWVIGTGWVEARELKAWDALLLGIAQTGYVDSVQRTNRIETVYNLEVEEFHSYFVGQSYSWVHNSCGAKRPFSSGKPPHEAEVTVERGGKIVSRETIKSGNMTAEEAELGFPRSSLATHTEARAVRSTSLEPGDAMTIEGQYPPCLSCKGAMNRAASESGASVQYKWEGSTWKANGGN